MQVISHVAVQGQTSINDCIWEDVMYGLHRFAPSAVHVMDSLLQRRTFREELLNSQSPRVPLYALDSCHLVRIKDRDTLIPEHLAYCTFAHACMACQSGPEME